MRLRIAFVIASLAAAVGSVPKDGNRQATHGEQARRLAPHGEQARRLRHARPVPAEVTCKYEANSPGLTQTYNGNTYTSTPIHFKIDRPVYYSKDLPCARNCPEVNWELDPDLVEKLSLMGEDEAIYFRQSSDFKRAADADCYVRRYAHSKARGFQRMHPSHMRAAWHAPATYTCTCTFSCTATFSPSVETATA